MTIVQQNSGTASGTSFTATLPGNSNASNRLVLIVAGNTTVTTLSGWTLRTSQVNDMGHYIYDRAGDGTASWGWTNGAGNLTWVLLEIQGGTYGAATSANNTASATTYATPSTTPTAGTRIVIASLASLVNNSTVRTLGSWTNSFVEQADLCNAAADYPMQGVAVLDNLTANGSTAYSTTGTYSATNPSRSAIIAWYTTTTGSTFTGTAAQTLGNVEQSGAGTFEAPDLNGTISQTLPKVAQAAAGTVDNPGVAAQTLPKVAQSAAGTFEVTALSIAEENALTGDPYTDWLVTGSGDTSNVGFARGFSVSVGATVEFSCHGSGDTINIYRVGYYDGDGSRLITSIVNTPTSQDDPDSISSSNGGTTCENWDVTASWAVPATATSGFYIGVYLNAAETDASWIPFVVYDDDREADIIVKTSESTWGVAYNSYGTPASPTSGGGKDFYGSNYNFDISVRGYANTWNKPMLCRSARPQTYWRNAELPLIMWLERNGYNVKYVSSWDVDQRSTCLDNGNIFISSGHDEYWSQPMRDNVEARRDEGMHLLFMSGNEVFWRTRQVGDISWCYKDTMPGPTGSGHSAGTALDPVSWTGTWKDTRSANNATRAREGLLTGTDFRMNGINNKNVTFDGGEAYASHVVWRNTTVTTGSDVTVNGLVGFEADEQDATRPGAVILAEQVFNIDDNRADDNGETYTNDGNLNWGIVSQRWPSGAVVVGFGTCQWAWGLDNLHDNGGAVANTTVRQFTYNLLRDIGAAPDTLMAGLTSSSPESLSNYGFAGVEGDAAQTLPRVAQSAAGTAEAEFTGTAAQTLPRVAQAATGTAEAEYTGTIAQTLPRVAQSASGTAEAEYEGSISQTLPRVTQSASGTNEPEFVGTAAQTLGIVGQAGAGTFTLPAGSGTAAQTLPHVTQSATGTAEAEYTGVVIQTLPHVTQSGAGTFVSANRTGSIVQTLGRVGQSVAGEVDNPPGNVGIIGQTLPRVGQSAAGTYTLPVRTGVAAQTLPMVSVSNTGTTDAPVFTGTLAQTLPMVTQLASTGAVALNVTWSGTTAAPHGHPFTVRGPS